MFCLQNLSMEFGDRVLFKEVNLNIKQNHIYGLVGANGSGKSTLIKILSGQASPTKGSFTHPKDLKVGFLNQDYYLFEEDSLIDIVLMGQKELWSALSQKQQLLKNKNLSEQELKKLARAEEKILALDGYKAESAAQSLLLGLGLDLEKHKQSLSSLSGGYKMRVLLAQLLFHHPDILLLDEPTNYLDIYTIKWFSDYLKTFQGSVLVSSHDREFLNDVAMSIIDLDFGRLKIYPGNYEDFVALKKEEIMSRSKTIAHIEKKEKHLTKFIERFGAKATKAKQAHSKEKILDKLEMEKMSYEILPTSRAYPDFTFEMGKRLPAISLKVSGISKAYGMHQVLKEVSFEVKKGEKVAILGPNGIGKSTLLDIITSCKRADSGLVQFPDSVSSAYFPQLFEKFLDFDQTILDYIQTSCLEATDKKIYNTLGKMLFKKEDLRKKIGCLSGGEKARVVLSTFMLKPYNFLIFDEPTNHLDMESSEMLLKALIEFPGCVLVVSHNRFFVENLANHVIEITKDKVTSFLGDYRSYLTKFSHDYLNYQTQKNLVKSKTKVQKKNEDKAKEKKKKQCEKQLTAKELELKNLNLKIQDPSFFSTSSEQEKKQLFQKKKNLEQEIEDLYQCWGDLLD